MRNPVKSVWRFVRGRCPWCGGDDIDYREWQESDGTQSFGVREWSCRSCVWGVRQTGRTEPFR